MDDELRAVKLNGKYTLQAALINGACLIIGAIIGIFSINYTLESKMSNNVTKAEGFDLQNQSDNLSDRYENLIMVNKQLQNENLTLQNQVDSLQDKVSEYNSSAEENASLKDHVKQLENELQIVNSTDSTDKTTSDFKHNIIITEENIKHFAQTTEPNVIIRSAPETSSNIIIHAEQGEKFLLLSTVTGTDGYEWHQIQVEKETGYVRSDLVTIVKWQPDE